MRRFLDFVLIVPLLAALGYVLYAAQRDGDLLGTLTSAATSTPTPIASPTNTRKPTRTPKPTDTQTLTPTQTTSPTAPPTSTQTSIASATATPDLHSTPVTSFTPAPVMTDTAVHLELTPTPTASPAGTPVALLELARAHTVASMSLAHENR